MNKGWKSGNRLAAVLIAAMIALCGCAGEKGETAVPKLTPGVETPEPPQGGNGGAGQSVTRLFVIDENRVLFFITKACARHFLIADCTL